MPAIKAAEGWVGKGVVKKSEGGGGYGFLEGYKGLIYGNYAKMKPSDF